MTMLVYAYVIVFLTFIIFEIRDGVRSGNPLKVSVFDALVHAVLFLGMVSYVFKLQTESMSPLWPSVFVTAFAASFILRVIAFRNEENDLEQSGWFNGILKHLVFAITALFLLPLYYLNFKLAYPDRPFNSIVVYIGFVMGGCLAVRIIPRFSSTYRSVQERKTVVRLKKEWQKAPDEIELFDGRVVSWNGMEDNEILFLFKFRREGQYFYTLCPVSLKFLGDLNFNFPIIPQSDMDAQTLDGIYKMYRNYYYDEISKKLIDTVANNMSPEAKEWYRQIMDSSSDKS